MINHVRTLLRNDYPPSVYEAGDEYVDPTYQPVVLPAALQTARHRLFGSGVDRYGQNITLARLWATIETHPVLQAAVRVDDSRVAISRATPPPEPTADGPGDATVVAAPHPFAADGRGYGAWSVTVTGGSALITSDEGTPVAIAATGIDDRYQVFLPGSAAYLSAPQIDGVWFVRLWAAPTHDFTDLLECNPGTLFESGEVEEDLIRLWQFGQFAWERAAAGAVALARRIDALRIS